MCRRLLSGIVVARHMPHIKVQSASVTGRLSPPSGVAGGNRADGHAVLLIPSTADAQPISSAGGRICFREYCGISLLSTQAAVKAKKRCNFAFYLRSPSKAKTSRTEQAPVNQYRPTTGHSASATQGGHLSQKASAPGHFHSQAACAMVGPSPSTTATQNKKLPRRRRAGNHRYPQLSTDRADRRQTWRWRAERQPPNGRPYLLSFRSV